MTSLNKEPRTWWQPVDYVWCGDHLCPCQDGDACHYKDYPGSPAMIFRGCNCEDCLTESRNNDLTTK